MPRENLPNVFASRNLKDTGTNKLGKQIADNTIDAQAAPAAGGVGPVLAQAEGKGGSAEHGGPKDERIYSNRDESCEPRAGVAVEGDVGGERRPVQAGTSEQRVSHEEQPSKPLGAYAYLAQSSRPKTDLEFRREEARTLLVRLLARRVASVVGTRSSVRKAA